MIDIISDLIRSLLMYAAVLFIWSIPWVPVLLIIWGIAKLIRKWNQPPKLTEQKQRWAAQRAARHQDTPEYRQRINAVRTRAGLEPRWPEAGLSEEDREWANQTLEAVATYVSRGIAYADEGEYGRAIRDFNQALRLDPNDARAYYNRGLASRRIGEYERARSDFNKALALGYARAAIEALLAQLPESPQSPVTPPPTTTHRPDTRDHAPNDAATYNDQLIHRTARGEAVRSKSEVIIANLLYAKGIDYRYEEPLEFDGIINYPDFTINDDNTGKTYYWEHLGMLSDQSYRRRWNEKLTWYKQYGVLPRKEGGGPMGTLVTTRDFGDGGIDSGLVSRLIDRLFSI